MNKTGPIVVATDLTARSDRPLDRAACMAAERGRGLVIVHILEEGTKREEKGRADEARRVLARLINGLDVPVEIRLESGRAPETLATVARQVGAAAIVVGAARYNHVSDFFLGTAVDYLVRNATMPVLIVKEKPTGPYDRIIVGTDFSAISRDALIVAADLLPAIPITLVHGYHSAFPARLGEEVSREVAEQWAREELDKFLDDAGLNVLRSRLAARLIEAQDSTAMVRAAEQSRNPVTVVGSHGLSGPAQAVLGSRASTLLNEIPLDILIVRKGLQ